jgi:hypothetical protein
MKHTFKVGDIFLYNGLNPYAYIITKVKKTCVHARCILSTPYESEYLGIEQSYPKNSWVHFRNISSAEFDEFKAKSL